MADTRTPLVFDQPKVGHFRRGATVLAEVLGGEALLAPIDRQLIVRLAAHQGPLLCQTADDYPLTFAVASLVRSLTGKRTAAITTRAPGQLASSGLKRAIRRVLFAMVRALPGVIVFTNIAPMGEIPGDWVFDTEWWDLSVLPMPDEDVPILRDSTSVVFLGIAGVHKGITFFLDVARVAYERRLPLRFIVAGNTTKIPAADLKAFTSAGGVVIPPLDRDETFVSYVRHAGWLWCCYHPESDKSSGIFGRALQLGSNTVVRLGSYLHGYQQKYGQGGAVEFGDVEKMLRVLMSPPRRAPEPRDLARFGRLSIAKIRRTFGLADDGEKAS